MKKSGIQFIGAIILMFALSATSIAQTNFEKDFSALHKKAIMTCGMIKQPKLHQQSEILKGLKELRTQLKTIEKNYLDKPPEAYASDPLWKSYFVEFNDVIDALQSRVEKGNYKVAAMNCSHICMVYYKIHAVNGRLDLTDKMFLWISQVTMTNNMLNAANYPGAEKNLKQVRTLYKNVIEAKKTANNPEFDKQFTTIDKLYANWLKDLENHKYQDASDTFNTFKAAFGKVFLMSLMY